ncbi:hypothetical protein D9756_003220 [Leucocoprinus leucothites]|uniref:Uncharacterized protein n=1 Tax=Leucocoprinus leucothites TaxID=201217 RepID=A0A8H5G7D2_9AGAR|nr:hypothetical protein D9756_003220 [Leucoagaricus leucothites]
MPSLAHRLNQLGAAHAQHLISDDDYRLLRRDLFEKHAAEPAPRSSQAPKHTPPPPSQPQLAPGPPLRRKGSVALGVANLFRRATGRSSKKHLPGVQETVAVLPGAQAPANSPDSSHLAPPPRRTTVNLVFCL